MLENFPSYTMNKGGDYNKMVKALNKIQHQKPKGRPKNSSVRNRFYLDLILVRLSVSLFEQLRLRLFKKKKKNIRNPEFNENYKVFNKKKKAVP